MATKKDLVEAYSFSRRRLVTAFVSGAPGGREVEPSRPGRTIVGGLALAVLLAAGAAVAGVFAPRTPEDWNQPGLVISKDTGAAYVILHESDHPELRPVINITSARLILGADAQPRMVSQDTIDAQTIGEDIGILGAPASLPPPSLLVDTGWTACTANGRGVAGQVSATPPVTPAVGRGLLVRSEGQLFLVAQPAGDQPGSAAPAYAYRVPRQRDRGLDRTDKLLLDLGVGISDTAIDVPRAWLNLFPPGGDLDWSSVRLAHLGAPAPDAGRPGSGVPARAEVGDVLTTADGRAALLTDRGAVDLDPFSLAVYENLATPDGFHKPIRVDDLPNTGFTSAPFATAHWPTTGLEPLGADPCAELVAEHGAAPSVRLAAAAPAPAPAADAAPAGTREVTVDPGRGAYVLSGGWEDTDHGTPYVVDGRGRADPLVGADAAERLGYAGYPVPVVPDTWMDLFDKGEELSVDAALCPPASPGRSGGSCG